MHMFSRQLKCQGMKIPFLGLLSAWVGWPYRWLMAGMSLFFGLKGCQLCYLDPQDRKYCASTAPCPATHRCPRVSVYWPHSLCLCISPDGTLSPVFCPWLVPAIRNYSWHGAQICYLESIFFPDYPRTSNYPTQRPQRVNSISFKEQPIWCFAANLVTPATPIHSTTLPWNAFISRQHPVGRRRSSLFSSPLKYANGCGLTLTVENGSGLSQSGSCTSIHECLSVVGHRTIMSHLRCWPHEEQQVVCWVFLRAVRNTGKVKA